MPTRPQPVLKQRIFEARYERGYRYLDRCGDALLILESLLAEETGCAWMTAEVTVAAARLKCPDLDMALVFDSRHLVLDQNPVGDVHCNFPVLAETALATIMGRFDLREMNRYGFRRVQVIPADSVDEAGRLSVRWCPVQDWRRTGDASLVPREYECVTAFETENREKGMRVSMKPYAAVGVELKVDDRLLLPPHHLPKQQRQALVEQLKRAKQRQKEPDAGLLLDVDYYLMWPPEGLRVGEFIKEAQEVADAVEADLLEERKQ